MATVSDRKSRYTLDVRMRKRKLGNIRPNGAFWQEVTLWNVSP